MGHKKHLCANKTFQSCCFTFIHLIILHFRAKAIIIFTLTPAASPVCFCVYVCSVCLIFIIRRAIAWATHWSLLHQKVGFIYYVLQTVQQHKDKPAVMWQGSHWQSSCYSWTDSFPAAAAAWFDSEAVKQFQLAINTFDEYKLGARNITDGKHNSRQWNHIRGDAGCRCK